MSSKVKERLKQMALELSHEERITLDEALDKLAMQMGIVIVSKDKDKQRGCDILIDQIPDDKLRELIIRIKKKKKKIEEVIAE
jgi:hypothetical protein